MVHDYFELVGWVKCHKNGAVAVSGYNSVFPDIYTLLLKDNLTGLGLP